MDIDQIPNFSTNEGTASETPWEKEMRFRWRATKDEEEKYRIQREWFCTKRDGDKPANSALRAKWAALFNRRVPVLEIMSIAQSDTDKHLAHLRELNDRLANLKLAHTANKKKAAAKEEAKREKQGASFLNNLSNLCYNCANEGCCNLATVIDEENTTIECEICRQMDSSSFKPDRVHNGWFCTEECKAAGELNHQIRHHPCASKSACIQRDNRLPFTKPTFAPDSTSPAITLCGWCLSESNRFTYFCSRVCAEKNFDAVHLPEDLQEWDEQFAEKDGEENMGEADSKKSKQEP